MPRIFACLGFSNLMVLAAAGAIGILKPGRSADYHVVLAVFALLLSCLIQVLVFTYFTVSGKVIGQAIQLAKLDAQPLSALVERKKVITRLLAATIVSIVLATATGAAHWRSGVWISLHWIAALIALSVHVVVLFREYELVAENHQDMEQTLSGYTQWREKSKSATVSSVSKATPEIPSD